MFNKTNQVQTIDVNEWVNKLMAARDDVKAVEKIREKLDTICLRNIEDRAKNLEKRTSLYDFYYDVGMPVTEDLALWIIDVIDYRMPDELVEKWAFVCEQYWKMKEDGKEASNGEV